MRKLIAAILILFMCVGFCIVFLYIPSRAARIYGPPASSLSLPERVQYSALLLWYDGLLTQPLDLNGAEQPFTIEVGESANSVANHLQSAGLIRDAEAFRSYLIYSGWTPPSRRVNISSVQPCLRWTSHANYRMPLLKR
jgi:hypothetical protein